MENSKIKIDIVSKEFLNLDGTFNKNKAFILSGHIAGECYDKDGLLAIQKEPIEKTIRRVNMTLDNGHHSVYDHINIIFNLQNLPKILAMVLNNEHQYTTSEKSARYTPVERKGDSIITFEEEKLYNKWIDIFKIKIKDKYGHIFNDSKIQKLAQENARYLVTVFMPTQMIYTTSIRQINYLVSWMQDYIKTANMGNSFENKLTNSMEKLIEELARVNVLEEKLMNNEKHRSLSIFGKNSMEKQEYFGDVYSTTYKGSFAQYAQAHRHRTLDYKLEMLEDKEYFIPPIIKDDQILVDEWLNDMKTVSKVTPQGELVMISEMGKYEDFILKCKERLCSAAQLEIAQQTRDTLLRYQDALKGTNNPLATDIENYTKGARCTFNDFVCTSDCHFPEGKVLTRKI